MVKIKVKIDGNTMNPRVCVDVSPKDLLVGGRKIKGQGRIREIIEDFKFVTIDAFGEVVVSPYNIEQGIEKKLRGLDDGCCVNCGVNKIVDDVIDKIKDEVQVVLHEVEEIEYCREFEI